MSIEIGDKVWIRNVPGLSKKDAKKTYPHLFDRQYEVRAIRPTTNSYTLYRILYLFGKENLNKARRKKQ
jgi:hypothetical protein